jgi:hypothetical protein
MCAPMRSYGHLDKVRALTGAGVVSSSKWRSSPIVPAAPLRSRHALTDLGKARGRLLGGLFLESRSG